MAAEGGPAEGGDRAPDASGRLRAASAWVWVAAAATVAIVVVLVVLLVGGGSTSLPGVTNEPASVADPVPYDWRSPAQAAGSEQRARTCMG